MLNRMSNPFSRKNPLWFHLGKGPEELVGEDGAAEAVVEQGAEIGRHEGSSAGAPSPDSVLPTSPSVSMTLDPPY